MFNATDKIAINLIEVANAEPLAGQLFFKSFKNQIPDFPTHYILLAENQKQQSLTLGYVHFTRHQNIYLGGGMCVNTPALKQLPQHLRSELSQQGGVAYYMLSESVKKLTDCDAVFGYVGHKGAYKIDLAVGFKQTQYNHLIVYWKKNLDQPSQLKLIELAHQQGPF